VVEEDEAEDETALLIDGEVPAIADARCGVRSLSTFFAAFSLRTTNSSISAICRL